MLSFSIFVLTVILCSSCNKGQWRTTEVQAAQNKIQQQQTTKADNSSEKKQSDWNFWDRTKNSLRSFWDGKTYSEPIDNSLSVSKTNPKAFCDLANNPLAMITASSTDLLQLVEWRTKMLTEGKTSEQCMSSCPNPTEAMKDFCYSLSWCQQNCTTSQIIRNWSSNFLGARDTLCVAHNCSPVPPPSEYYNANKILPESKKEAGHFVAPRTSDLKVSKDDLEVRKKIFLEIARKIMLEFEETTYTAIFADDYAIPDAVVNTYSELAKAYQSRFFDVKKYLTNNPSVKNNYIKHLPETMLCINLPTSVGGEDHYLEVMEQNNGCGNAFGLGQVISMTFYSNLGLNLSSYGYNTARLDKKCKSSPLQFLATECGTNIFQSQFFRIELFRKYLGYNIDELFDRRSFDMELQVRLMFATIINSFAMTNNWWGAFASYRGDGSNPYASFTANNHSCMVTHMSAQYKTDSSPTQNP